MTVLVTCFIVTISKVIIYHSYICERPFLAFRYWFFTASTLFHSFCNFLLRWVRIEVHHTCRLHEQESFMLVILVDGRTSVLLVKKGRLSFELFGLNTILCVNAVLVRHHEWIQIMCRAASTSVKRSFRLFHLWCVWIPFKYGCFLTFLERSCRSPLSVSERDCRLSAAVFYKSLPMVVSDLVGM